MIKQKYEKVTFREISYLYRCFIGIKVLAVIRMNISSLPVQLVVYDLVHVWISKPDVVGVRIDEVAELESVAEVHEEAPLSVTLGEGHIRIQIGIFVGWSGRLVGYNSRVDQVAVTHERHVPESPETDVST